MSNNGNGEGGEAPPPPIVITNEMVAQFMLQQQQMNANLNESNQQIHARLQALQTASSAVSDTAPPNTTSTDAQTQHQETKTTSEGPVIGATNRPKHSQRHPDKFTGKDESIYPMFKGILIAKLRIDARAIGTLYEQVWYAFGCLSDTASSRIFPWMSYADGTEDFTTAKLFEQMDLAFLDLQKQSKAISKINTIKQSNRGFREFLRDFDQTLMEANGWSWDDAMKMGLLKAALVGKITKKLIGKEEPSTYSVYVAQIRRIADDLDEWEEKQKFKARYQKQQFTGMQQNPPTRSPQPMGDSMEWEPTHTTSTSAARTTLGQQQSSTRPRARWVEKSVLDARKSAGQCLRCGSNEHFIGQCGYGAARRPENSQQPAKRQEARTAAAVSRHSIVEDVQDEEYSSSGSEN